MKFPGNSDFVVEDPLVIDPLTGSGNTQASHFSNIGAVITYFFPYIMAFAGFVLFFGFIWGGFTLLTSAGNPESVKKGQQIVMTSLIGFVIIFIAYWLIQILSAAFGITLPVGA